MRFFLFCAVLLLMSVMMLVISSCQLPGASNLPSTNNGDNGGGDDDDDDDDRDRRICGDNSACQVSCENLFCSNSARNDCYDLDFNEIDQLNAVSDALDVTCNSDDEMEMGSITKSDLDDLSKGEWESYLKIGLDDLVEAFEEENHTDKAKTFLKWVASNDDIAEAALSYDKDLDLGRIAFERYGHQPDGNLSSVYLAIDKGSSSTDQIQFESSQASVGSSGLFRVRLGLKNIYNFVTGFIRINLTANDESFMSYSHGEGNEKAFEWGHNTVVNFCEDLTDRSKDHVNVKQCLQAVYCAHRIRSHSGTRTVATSGGGANNGVIHIRTITIPVTIDRDGIFRELDRDYRDLVGRTSVDLCAGSKITDEDRIEDFWD